MFLGYAFSIDYRDRPEARQRRRVRRGWPDKPLL